MSKLLKTARNLLSPKHNQHDHDLSTDTDGDTGVGDSDVREEESGSRMSSDICVPQLGHTTGYSHEMGPAGLGLMDEARAGARAGLTSTSPISTSSSMYSPTSHQSPTSTSTSKALPNHPSHNPTSPPVQPFSAGSHNAQHTPSAAPPQLSLKQVSSQTTDRPTCSLGSMNNREMEERIERQLG